MAVFLWATIFWVRLTTAFEKRAPIMELIKAQMDVIKKAVSWGCLCTIPAALWCIWIPPKPQIAPNKIQGHSVIVIVSTRHLIKYDLCCISYQWWREEPERDPGIDLISSWRVSSRGGLGSYGRVVGSLWRDCCREWIELASSWRDLISFWADPKAWALWSLDITEIW